MVRLGVPLWLELRTNFPYYRSWWMNIIDVSPVKILILPCFFFFFFFFLLLFFRITSIKKAHSLSISNFYDARITNTERNTIWNNIVQSKYSRLVSDHCFYLGFTALSRIFHLYQVDRSSKVSVNQRTRGTTTWPSVGFPTCDPSGPWTTAVRRLMD